MSGPPDPKQTTDQELSFPPTSDEYIKVLREFTDWYYSIEHPAIAQEISASVITIINRLKERASSAWVDENTLFIKNNK